MGNLGSILNMMKFLDIEAEVSNDAKVIESASKLILPGVGSFDNGMNRLKMSSFYEILYEKVVNQMTPILGICLGMQLMTLSSEEGIEEGLGWINAHTIKFSETNDIKVPQIGWNRLNYVLHSPLINYLDESSKFYFVHSYHVRCEDRDNRVATANYGVEFDAIFAKDNIFGCQFHPEKSHKYGMQIFRNFDKV